MPPITLNPEISIVDILTLVGLLLTVLGLAFAGYEIRRSVLVQRAQFIMSITEQYFGDEDVRKFYYRLDYNEFVLDFGAFIGSDEERWLDSLLYTFDTVGRMVKMGAVSIKDVDLIAFQASRVLRNPEVKKYLDWLDGEYANEDSRLPAHSDARYLIKKLYK